MVPGHQVKRIEVPSKGEDFYEMKLCRTAKSATIFPQQPGLRQHIFVYTPPGYDANRDTRYPVLYLQHRGR